MFAMMFEWDAEHWIAVGTIALALATIILVVAGFWQARSIVRDNKKWRTIDICLKYDTDPILDASARASREWKMKGCEPDTAANIKLDVNNILNYLDGIAIGISQNLYIEDLARDHLDHILRYSVEFYLGDEDRRSAFGLQKTHYKHLIALCDKWSPKDESSPPVRFQDGINWRGLFRRKA